MLKRKLAGVVMAGLLLGAGAVNATTESAFPGNADEGSTRLPARSTYADQHRGVQAQSARPAFPGNADEGSTRLPARSTRADTRAGVSATGSAFPVSDAKD